MKTEFYLLPMVFCAIVIVAGVLFLAFINDFWRPTTLPLATPPQEKCDPCKEIHKIKSKLNL